MSKFNERKTMRTVNKSGYAAYQMTDKEKLVTQVLTSFFSEPKFYGDNSGEILQGLAAVCDSDPAFVAKLGLFARSEFNMRSVSHVVGAVLANRQSGKPYARAYVNRACMRADDMTEILAFYITKYGKPIPNSLKKGLTDALRRFDEYALAKYDRNGAVKLRDIIQIAHPSPKTAEQEQLWKRVLERDLATPLTWETQLSAHGNTRAVWERLIEENALGYMAMLRNLRNIVEADPRNIGQVYAALANSERVRRSRVLPFRFYAAHRELKNHPRATSATLGALEKAIQAAVSNIRQIPGKSLIAIDVSGSMSQAISQKSKVSCRDIACLIGAVANRICEDTLIVTFDTQVRKYSFPRGAGILATADSMACNGGGTNIHLPFEYLLQNRIRVDRVIMLSDNEINRGWRGRGYYGNGRPAQESADACRQALNPRMWVHAIDLQGYGTQQFIGEGTDLVAGWSEKVLEFIALAEGGVDSLIKRIEQVEL